MPSLWQEALEEMAAPVVLAGGSAERLALSVVHGAEVPCWDCSACRRKGHSHRPEAWQ